MKNLFSLLVVIAYLEAYQAIAQTPDNICAEKMKVFALWPGHWQGEGALQTGPGPAKTSMVDEQIEFKLEGTLVVMEGIGKSTDPASGKESIKHHAFGILSYDQNSNQYKLRSYLNDGKNTDAWFTVLGENKFQWGFDVPQGKIRYSITINTTEKKWNEIGEFSSDGNTWNKFFEMNLKKVG